MIRVCCVKTHCGSIMDLFLPQNFNLGLQWQGSVLMAGDWKGLGHYSQNFARSAQSTTNVEKSAWKSEVKRHPCKMHHPYSWLYSSSYTHVVFPLGYLSFISIAFCTPGIPLPFHLTSQPTTGTHTKNHMVQPMLDFPSTMVHSSFKPVKDFLISFFYQR